MNPEELKKRTKQFGLRVIRLVQALPRSQPADVIGKQLLRSATSVGANYRAACRARSLAEFAAKISIAIEEADESGYWMELLVESGLMQSEPLTSLIQEADELTAILTASVITARKKLSKEKQS